MERESAPRSYLAAAGEAVATNAGQPWNVVAGLANDAGTFVLERFRGRREGQDSAGVAVSAESR